MSSARNERRPVVLMVGPRLGATSGISAVVNTWLSAGLTDRVELMYISTLTDYVPGQYAKKLGDALRAYGIFGFRVARRRPDIVHIHLSTGMSFYRKWPIFWCAKLLRLPLLVHLHGSGFREFYCDGAQWRRSLIRGVLEGADVLLVLSDSWRTFVESIAPQARMKVLYNAALLPAQVPSRASGGPLTIGCMGRLGQRKGTYDLLRAFEQVAKRCPQSRLLLAGDGDVDAVRRLVGQDGLAERVQVLGWVSSAAKTLAYEEMNIYCLPSYNEGLPNSVVEAMAVGLPIVSTPVGGIPEAVADGVEGFLVDPGDVRALSQRLIELCNDAALRGAMAAQARATAAARFNAEKIVEELVEIYNGVAEG